MSCGDGILAPEHAIRQGLTGSLCNSSAKPTKLRKLDSRFISAQSLSPSQGRGLGGTSPALIPPVSRNLNSSMSTVLSMLACIGHHDVRSSDHSFIQHVDSLRLRHIRLVTMTSNICDQEAAYTPHAGTLCKLYVHGCRQDLMCSVGCRALVIALVKQSNSCHQKGSSSTGSGIQKSEEQPDAASQHKADE